MDNPTNIFGIRSFPEPPAPPQSRVLPEDGGLGILTVPSLTKFWKSFHNSIIIALLFCLLGVGIGVKVCKEYYVTKMDECIQTGAMLHKSKVFVLSPKM